MDSGIFAVLCDCVCLQTVGYCVIHVANFRMFAVQYILTLKVLVTTIDAQWEGMGDVGSARCEPALLPPCPTIRVLSYSS